MARHTTAAKAAFAKRRQRRQWLAFVRMCRYGVSNFNRNAWLTVAATAVMTITLLIIFVSFATQVVLNQSVDQIRSSVKMSVYVRTDTPDEVAQAISGRIGQLESVKEAVYQSSSAGRSDLARQHSNNVELLEALNEATNHIPGVINARLVDINDPSELAHFVATDEQLKKYLNPDHPPSYDGPRRGAIDKIGRFANFAQSVGIGATVLFVIISSLIVFNTIRMAIFTRKEEIQMMKLIGADRSFIRGPFIVEAVMYGFVAALVATACGLAIPYLAKGALDQYSVDVMPIIHLMTTYWALILLAMIAIGALIGVVSSYLATRRYLKL